MMLGLGSTYATEFPSLALRFSGESPKHVQVSTKHCSSFAPKVESFYRNGINKLSSRWEEVISNEYK